MFSCVEFALVIDDTILHGVERDMCNDEPVHGRRQRRLGMRRV